MKSIYRIIPESSVRIAFCLGILTVLFFGANCSSDLFKPKEVPVITGLEADHYEVDPGDTVRVTVSVKDPDDESLQYNWSGTGGQFIPPVNQPQVLWKAPEEGGDFKLTVKVSNEDGDSEPSSEIIHVKIKVAPEITALVLSAYEVDPGDTVRVTASLKDTTDRFLSYSWTADAGELLQPVNQSAVSWKAPSVGGTYQIRLVVSNGAKQSQPRSETITVRSYAAPFVQITIPVEGAVFIQYSRLDVSVTADHQNGIQSVSFYVNDSLISRQNGTAGENYTFSCQMTGHAGLTRLRAEAVARITGVTGSDEVEIRVEGIVLGK